MLCRFSESYQYICFKSYSVHIFSPFLEFLGALERYKLQLFGQILTLSVWPVFIEKFNCELLRNDAGGEVQLIILFLYFYWAVGYGEKIGTGLINLNPK